MSRWSALCIAAVLSAIGSTSVLSAANPHQEEMPEILWGPEFDGVESRPIFVADTQVYGTDGEINSQLFGEGAVWTIERAYLSQEPEQPCLSLHQPSDQWNTPELHWRDFSSALADSDFVVVAKVTGIQPGFNSHGLGGSLLRLKPQQWLKGEAEWTLSYLQFPAGEVKLGDRRFCLSHGQYPEVPEVGDRLLIAYQDTINNRLYPWIATAATNLITLKANGEAKLPRWSRSKHPSWVGKPAPSLVAEVRRILRDQAEEKPEP